MQEPGNRARRGDLADQVDVADVDPQFQRGSRDQHLQLAALEPLLGVETKFFGQAAMVGGYRVLAETLAQVPTQAFGQAPGVDENQRGPVFAGEGGEAVIDQFPDVVGHDRRQRHGRHFDIQVARPGVADIDDFAGAVATDQKTRDRFDRFLRGRQADAHQGMRAQCLQAFQAQGQVAAAFAGGDGVDFVDDDRVCGARAFAGRSRSRAARRGIPGVVTRMCGAVLRMAERSFCGVSPVRTAVLIGTFGQAHHAQLFGDAGQRVLQVDLDVVGQRLERRNVDHQGFVRQAIRRSPGRDGPDRRAPPETR